MNKHGRLSVEPYAAIDLSGPTNPKSLRIMKYILAITTALALTFAATGVQASDHHHKRSSGHHKQEYSSHGSHNNSGHRSQSSKKSHGSGHQYDSHRGNHHSNKGHHNHGSQHGSHRSGITIYIPGIGYVTR